MRSPLELIFNFHWVVPGDAARSAHENFGFLKALLRRRGIRSVINLRGRHPQCGWWRREDRICRSLGVEHRDAMLDSRLLPSRAMLATLMDAFDTAARPLLMKCSGGQDRASLAAALYLVHRLGWGAQDEARGQFAPFPYLHFPKPEQVWLRHFLAYAQGEAASLSLQEWIKTRYEPGAFRAWLDAGGLKGTYRGLFPEPAHDLEESLH